MTLSPDVLVEVTNALSRHTRGWPVTLKDLAAKLVATVFAQTTSLEPAQRKRLADNEELLLRAVQEALSTLATANAPPRLGFADLARPVEVSHGRGLGTPLDSDEGRRRLAAVATPVRLEQWAGPVVGPGELEKALGVKRSTLQDWHKRGSVIRLLKGERKHVYPLAQFVDGRPVQGMSRVHGIIPNARAAWQWLITDKPSIGGAPLDLLKQGRVDDVVAAAGRDFG